MRLSRDERAYHEDTIHGLLLLLAPRLQKANMVLKIRRFKYPEASYYVRRGLGGVVIVIHPEALTGIVKLAGKIAYEALEMAQNRTLAYRIQEEV
jgi:hypothetical protein